MQMNTAKPIYRMFTFTLSGVALVAVLLCCVAFIGCPTAEEMADDAVQPMTPAVPPPPEDSPPPTDEAEESGDVPPPP